MSQLGPLTPGPLYTKILNDFARSAWNIEAAMQHSDSLRRAVDRLVLLARNMPV